MRVCLRLSENAEGGKDTHVLLQSLSFNWDCGICFHNKQLSFDRYLSWQKSILVQFTHSTEPEVWLFRLSIFPSQVSYIFVIYVEIQSFLDITGTTSIDLI